MASLLLALLLLSLNFNVNLSSPNISSTHLCHPDQSIALLQFKNSLTTAAPASYKDCKWAGNISYPKTESWKEGWDCCSWDGVTCDIFTGHVIGLDLSCSWLQGPLQFNSTLFLLPHLHSVNLAYNDFQDSPISSKFGQFSSLTHLNLSNSEFSGLVPPEISHLSKLVSLDLSSNWLQLGRYEFEGILQNLTKLNHLVLNHANMSTIIPGTLSNFSSSLETLSLFHCHLQGNFPENVFRLPNLKFLRLSWNRMLNGTFPKSNWSGPLEHLGLWDTGFSGPLPSSIGNLNSLKLLDIDGCSFVGVVPDSIGNLTSIEFLTMGSNFFTFLGDVFRNLTNLAIFDIQKNNFTGQIPLSIFYLKQSLTHLDLSDNQLNGQISSSIFELENLTYIDVSSNNFGGILDFDMLSKLKNLEFLDLSNNSLTLEVNKQVHSNGPKLRHLDLSFCNMTSFPHFLSTQNNLTSLSLSHSNIQGEIPDWLWLLTNASLFSLDLSHNFLTRMPVFPMPSHLSFLDLSFNMIQGPLSSLISSVPSAISSSICFFVSNNKFYGEIPSSICNITFLVLADLSANNLSGRIPECLGNLSYLSVLKLRMNNVTGPIPGNFLEGNSLRNLDLNGNQLDGPLPQSLVNCEQLEILDIGNNEVEGEFPEWLESLPELQILILRSNRFHGSIGQPKSSNPFTKLRILDLSNNAFTGLLPREYFNNMKAMMNEGERYESEYMGDGFYKDSEVMMIKGQEIVFQRILTILATIDLSNNKFEGQITDIVGSLNFLKGLNFSHNNLSGSIPSSLANMVALESLDLSCNNLVGEIPWQLTKLVSLSILNVSHNQLEGPIPQGNQFRTFSSDSYIGNTGLCNFPLAKQCTDETSQDEGDSSRRFDWKIVLTGYASGLVIGFSVGYMVLTTTKPLWFLKMIEQIRYKKDVRRRNRRLKQRRNF